jgi:hypothetical protein
MRKGWRKEKSMGDKKRFMPSSSMDFAVIHGRTIPPG